MPSFNEYKAYVSRVFSTVPQWPDVETLLGHIQDKSGAKLGFGDLMVVLNTDDPMRVLSATVILTGGAMPIMKPFLKVMAYDGTMHEVSSIPKQCLDGDLPYTLEAKGEVIHKVGERTYTAFQVASFS
jgi:hypothetical protein